jgi:hypothetical protein
MLGRWQTVVIALFACLVVGFGWVDRRSSQLPLLPRSEQQHQQSVSAARNENPGSRLDWNNWTHDPIAVFTALLTLFNGLLFVSTIGLWLATRKSAGISERALTDLERPYIFFGRIESDIHDFFRPNLSWDPERTWPEFTLFVVNYGRTPGNIDAAAIFLDFLENIPPEIAFESLTSEHPDAGEAEMIVGQGLEFAFPRLRARQNFTRELKEKLRQGTIRLYCHGLFVYRDIFGNNHTTKFCRRYDPRIQQWISEGGRQRNSAD